MRATTAALFLLWSATAASAQQPPGVDPARADAAIKSAFPTAPADWQSRLVPDETMRQCSAHRNNPPGAVAEAIRQRESQPSMIKERLGAILSPETLPPETVTCPAK